MSFLLSTGLITLLYVEAVELGRRGNDAVTFNKYPVKRPKVEGSPKVWQNNS